ncbi:MAG TPA: hypothetical protein VD948_13100 [Rhodothermales bacterium]|nr:hypothetical protein [Rhodothermales bacterium]
MPRSRRRGSTASLFARRLAFNRQVYGAAKPIANGVGGLSVASANSFDTSTAADPYTLTGSNRCDRLTVTTEGSGTSICDLHYPASPRTPERAWLLIGGHGSANWYSAGYGYKSLAEQLLARGEYVIGTAMPCYAPNAASWVCDHVTTNNHTTLCTAHEAAGVSALRPYLDGALGALNHAISTLSLKQVCAAGLSGGAWGVMCLAALDERIGFSAASSGASPWWTLSDLSSLDGEQFEARPWWPLTSATGTSAFGQEGLYALAAFPNRRHLMLLRDNDTGVYASAGRHHLMRSVEAEVRSQLRGNRLGRFDLVIEGGGATDHLFTATSIATILAGCDQHYGAP